MYSTLLRNIALGSLLVCALHVTGCGDKSAPEQAPEDRSGAPRYGVEIVSSRSLGTMDVRAPGTGEVVGVACATCHGLERETQPESIHGGLEIKHGSITCNMCHSEGDRSTLHLADGREVLFEDAMELCAQCHGPQTRDYNRGSHGGMSGYWDLTRGPRVRNDCTNCHDPHSPAYPTVDPAPGPRDRFLKTHQTDEGAHE